MAVIAKNKCFSLFMTALLSVKRSPHVNCIGMEMNRSAYITGLSVIKFCLHTRIKYAYFAYLDKNHVKIFSSEPSKSKRGWGGPWMVSFHNYARQTA